MATSSRLPRPPPLTDEEILSFFHDIAGSKTASHITYSLLEAKLRQVHDVLAPNPKKHHLHHPSRAELEGGAGLRDFLLSLLSGINNDDKEAAERISSEGEPLRTINAAFQISRDDFLNEVRKWDIPSPDQRRSAAQAAKASARAYLKRIPLRRKVAAYWSVSGPTCLFMALVIALQTGMGIWQGVTYLKDQPIRKALGWGVILAKFAAGALLPTLFFMLTSMSRWFITILRRSYFVSRFINADFHQDFHVRMAITCLVLATLHAIGHLAGDFLYASRPERVDALIAVDMPIRTYRNYVATIPGWSGLASIIMFWIIALLATPAVRRWSYEVFQISHLLMFPMICLLCVHDTKKLLQAPMIGYWLAFPGLLVVLERLHRLYRSFRAISARLQILDHETVCLTARHPRKKAWTYSAGQYILLQVPRLSRFQFHPFTISACVHDCLQVHIKTNSGNWTSALHALALEVGPEVDVQIAIDGPFGAPAQRFYDYRKSIIVGSGIGITPFVAALTDLEQKALQRGINPWRNRRRSSMQSAPSRPTSMSFEIPWVRLPQSAPSRPTSMSFGTPWLRSPRPSLTADDHNIEVVSMSDIRETRTRYRVQSCDQSTKSSFEEYLTSMPLQQREGRKATATIETIAQRRVDFVWLVRDATHLLWFSDLLNRLTDIARFHRKQLEEKPISAARTSESPAELPVDLRVNTFITATAKNISTHVFRVLLDRYRSKSSSVSALTGLRTESSFGRPDLEAIMCNYYEDVVSTEGYRGDIGVFFCGTPSIGRVLADQCAQLTAQARSEDIDVRFHFLTEVFG
ncbi:hypothetical protein CF326_g907 [Tilletia indica]|nr:hypothetical protein CF326_g907 [Tilletia indica]